MLLNIESIRARLDERFIPLEPMITGLRLVTKTNQEPALAECEHKLGISFPSSFADLTTQFDFGYLTIGPIAFCNTGNYFDWLCELNQDTSSDERAWWPGIRRPEEHVMIAIGDPFQILLNAKTGRIFSSRRISAIEIECEVVADQFDLFVRGIGTAMLERNPGGGNENLARDIASSMGVKPDSRFWLSLTH